jgi:hypothetical protein
MGKNMKKALVLLVGLSLFLPCSASADYIGTGLMDVDYSNPYDTVKFPENTYYANYYTDYDVKTGTYTGPVQLTSGEVFCVENADMDGSLVNYDFYTIDSTLNYYSNPDMNLDALIGATWMANWAVTEMALVSNDVDKDTIKSIAQLAIWSSVLNADISKSTLAYNSYTAQWLVNQLDLLDDQALSQFVNDWVLAVNPAKPDHTFRPGEIGQNYLVHAPAPVPEPTTTVLVCIGTAGLAGVLRRRRK